MRFITRDQRKKDVYWHFWCKRRGYYYTNKFLWLPVEINGEFRWLQKAKIRWRVDIKRDFVGDTYFSWSAIEFIN